MQYVCTFYCNHFKVKEEIVIVKNPKELDIVVDILKENIATQQLVNLDSLNVIIRII